MPFRKLVLFSTLAIAVPPLIAQVQTAAPLAATAPTVVPALIPYNSIAESSPGKPLTGETSMTFLIFKDETGGEPVWVESQRVGVDEQGRYSVQLGASSASGVPLGVFASGEARWLEVQISGQKPKARVLLSTVPYAAKAADAATLGGLPASAFALAGSSQPVSPVSPASSADGVTPNASSGVTTAGGTSKYVPVFTGASTIGNSEIYDTGKSVGIGDVPNPSARLDVNGAIIMRGNMIVSRTGNATAAQGFPSYGFQFFSNLYNSSTKSVENDYFALQSEPVGNNTAAPSATFNLLYSKNGKGGETGFFINPNGTLHFAPGQTFPGTVTGVGLAAPSSDFTVSNSPITNSGYLSFDWKTPPTDLSVPSSIVKRDANGNFNTNLVNANIVGSVFLNIGSTAYFRGPVGIGLNNPAAELNLDAGGTANADSLLLGNTSSKGLQLRDNGTGVDMESIGVPLNINYVTQQPTYINPTGGRVIIGDTGYSVSDGLLRVGALDINGEMLSASFTHDAEVYGKFYVYSDLEVSGSKDFKIDHPLDPSNKYLRHAAIESSEVLNQYSGNVVTDGNGLATVQLPEWFGVENIDFRYQLTVIGGRFAQAIISKEIENNQFSISTNASNVKVSWQVTAKRNDAYMRAHPFRLEEEKPEGKRGHYDHPELFGHPELAHGYKPGPAN